MKKLLIVMTLLFASSTSAQYPTTSFTAGGNITAASASCLGTNCVPIKLPASATTLTVGVTGTFSATLAVEESQDGGRTWTSAGSNITGAGTTSFTITAFSDFRVRASAYVSGNAGVNILVSASTNSGGSGVSSLNSLSGAVTIAAGTNVTLTPSGNTITIASTGGGGGFTPSINGTPLSTAGLNLETSTANVTGLICTPTLVSTINVIPCEVSGTINAANVSTLNQNTTGNAATATSAANGITVGTTGFFQKAASNTTLANTLCDEGVTTASTVTCTDTGGVDSPTFTALGTTAGFVDYPQGSSSAAVAPCNVTASWCVQAGPSMTAGVETLNGTHGQGTVFAVGSSSALQDGNSGDANHSVAINWGTGTTIAPTSLCSMAICPAGTYRVNAYIDVTTACTTTGSYIINIIYTDDSNVSKTVPIPINGTGVTFATGTLVPISTTDYGQGVALLRSLGTAAISYSSTPGACATGGPAQGRLYLSIEAVQ